MVQPPQPCEKHFSAHFKHTKRPRKRKTRRGGCGHRWVWRYRECWLLVQADQTHPPPALLPTPAPAPDHTHHTTFQDETTKAGARKIDMSLSKLDMSLSKLDTPLCKGTRKHHSTLSPSHTNSTLSPSHTTRVAQCQGAFQRCVSSMHAMDALTCIHRMSCQGIHRMSRPHQSAATQASHKTSLAHAQPSIFALILHKDTDHKVVSCVCRCSWCHDNELCRGVTTRRCAPSRTCHICYAAPPTHMVWCT